MSVKHSSRKVEFTARQRAEHRRLRELFRHWRPSPEELITANQDGSFGFFGEYRLLRPFLARLKQSREQEGLSLADVSRRSGIDKAALSRLENGQNPNPTLDTLWRYAAALGKQLLLDTADLKRTAPTATARNNGRRKRTMS